MKCNFLLTFTSEIIMVILPFFVIMIMGIFGVKKTF